MGIEVVIVLLLIVANGLLSMSELAIVSARSARLKQMADQGNSGAAIALVLAAEPNRFLSTVQIGITLIGGLNGAFGGATLSRPIAALLARIPALSSSASQIAPILVVLVITYLSLVIGELVPKRLALRSPERMAALMAPVLGGLLEVTAPVAALLAYSTDLVLRIFGPERTDENQVSEEEIELLIQQGTEAGVFHEAELRLVEGVFDVGERSVGELMTPRHAVDVLDLSRTSEENRETMRLHPHSRYPVCDGSVDNIVGVVSTHELWRRQIGGESTDIRQAMQPALFVPEISPVFTVIDQMRTSRHAMAILIDEYGGFDGIITFNDILSDLVGELDDPARTNLRGAVARPDGSWLIDGVFPAHELRELLAIDELPGEDAGRFESVGGFLMDQLGHIPQEGEIVTWDRFSFEIMDMDGNRIDKVLVSPISTEPIEPD